MKIFATIFAALSVLSFSAFAQSVYTPVAKDIKISKINIDTTNKSPDIKADYVKPHRTDYQNWLEIEVEFSVDVPPKFEVVDELTFEYLVEVGGKLCSGTVTHVNIAKGNSLYSVMYMPPAAIHRLTGKKDLNSAAIGNVWITISKNGGLLAKKSDKPGEPKAASARLTGQLIPKNETPFSAFWWDRYEAIKPAGK